jgi:hypothetical protein
MVKIALKKHLSWQAEFVSLCRPKFKAAQRNVLVVVGCGVVVLDGGGGMPSAGLPSGGGGEQLLSAEELAAFREQGYLSFPGVVPDALSAAVCADLDALMLRPERPLGGGPSERAAHIAETVALGGLAVFAPVVERVGELMRAHGAGRV